SGPVHASSACAARSPALALRPCPGLQWGVPRGENEMAATTEDRRDARIDAVVAQAAAPSDGSGAILPEGFAREYFHQVDEEDLDERAPGDLAGALRSHWQLAAQRPPGVVE